MANPKVIDVQRTPEYASALLMKLIPDRVWEREFGRTEEKIK